MNIAKSGVVGGTHFALERLKQEEHEFEATWGHIAGPCIKQVNYLID
jgi:hypothetical protein